MIIHLSFFNSITDIMEHGNYSLKYYEIYSIDTKILFSKNTIIFFECVAQRRTMQVTLK